VRRHVDIGAGGGLLEGGALAERAADVDAAAGRRHQPGLGDGLFGRGECERGTATQRWCGQPVDATGARAAVAFGGQVGPVTHGTGATQQGVPQRGQRIAERRHHARTGDDDPRQGPVHAGTRAST
jgi:hypothetical protein